METSNLILIEHVCSNCDVEFSFIKSLNDCGLIEIIVVEDEMYISNEQLKDIERAIHFYYKLNINIEGIDVIHNLLDQINDLQEELRITKNKLDEFDLY
ncbi:MAG: chaperone modulator CbpM [Salibacteraceae bacterium]